MTAIAGPDVMVRWDRPDAPVPPVPPVPPAPPAPHVPAVVPIPAVAPARAGKKARSLEFYVKDEGKELRATLPITLARSADRFLPRSIQQYLDRFEVDLGRLLEIADALEDGAIPADPVQGSGLSLFQAKEEGVQLKVTLKREW